MIKDIIVKPRGSGKSTWAQNMAEDNYGFYISSFDLQLMSKLRSLPKLKKKLIVIDEVFYCSAAELNAILDYQDCYDFYLIGTPPTSLQRLPSKRFVDYLYANYPELMI